MLLDFNAHRRKIFPQFIVNMNAQQLLFFISGGQIIICQQKFLGTQLIRTADKFVPLQKDDPKKTKGMHVKEIRAFEHFCVGLFLSYGRVRVLGMPNLEIGQLKPFDSKSQMITRRREICSLDMGSQVTQRKHFAKIKHKCNQKHK